MGYPQERWTQRLPKSIRFNAVTRLTLFLLIMVEVSSGFLSSHPTEALLVPSQVKTNSKIKNQSKLNNRRNNRKKGTLVPSQVLFSHPDSLITPEISTTPSLITASTTAPSETLVPPGKSNPNQKRRNRRKKSNTPTKLDRDGNLPDIEWRAIPMDHLRQHPNFVPLPTPESVQRLKTLEDVRIFRQDSWQWDVLHHGRCTTSQAVAALGFLEPEAGKILGVPRSWQRGGLGAYYRLGKPALRTFEEMNSILCAEYNGSETDSRDDKDQTNIWTSPKTMTGQRKEFPFAAKYMVKISQEEKQRRQKVAKQYAKSPGFGNAVRMMWGNTQEATSLLTAINFFSKNDTGIVLKEVGMCGAGLETNQTENSGLLVGASPDGLLCYPDGRVEVLEVKNHCPFYAKSYSRRVQSAQKNHKRFSIRHFEFEKAGVLPHYVPQLMMEMLCVGPNCQSAVMIRQSATTGALILRIKRDDAWIDEMLYWLNRFQIDFVESEIAPFANFFMNGTTADKVRYKKFLNCTKDLETNVELLAHVPHSDIQRAMGTTPGTTNLFLD